MKSALILAAALGMAATASMAAGKEIEGAIRKFECGDNCYLTIVDAAKHEHTGLCVARECQAWNERTEMPRAMIGKKVRVVAGTGKQFDASGKVQGQMMSFQKIIFVP